MSPFEEVLEQYEPMISSIIRKLHIYREFEQFRQAGRIALWQAWSRFDETKWDFAPFAYRSIRGALLDELKRETRFNDVHVPAEDDLLEYAGSETEDDTSTFSRLEEALVKLTAEEKELLILLYEDRVTQTTCAAHFGISVAGVKKRRERLLAKLRGQLKN
ncbi:sigma-70 family RNA polymerase sigma factor [Sporosarcina trichiuri]|uniref:sigma-70 family RNA polymerase sigma factor n=1 Tax=Sporosarcina trichiuri TaxID=3056445 RepID=UPI0025B606BC|nr:sigma-70 family RNA polymerase sigma factor [Sporosarcina sp. 0.2-SM1T-5]WJY26386.1 sigma-70 family RNA polymerase sigma factor [Sporosarcina sp. 0.2-SM1T-5]